jgi:hypothetical protein
MQYIIQFLESPQANALIEFIKASGFVTNIKKVETEKELKNL